jgi:hypothetical protein
MYRISYIYDANIKDKNNLTAQKTIYCLDDGFIKRLERS